MRKIAAFILAAAVSLSAINANFRTKASESTENALILQNKSSYEKYIAENSYANITTDTIVIALDKFLAVGSGNCLISTAAESIGNLFWQGAADISWDINVKEAGFYCFEMRYFSESENNSCVSFGISIDGEFPFDDAREVKFDRYWKNKHSIRLDENHENQVLPDLVQYNTSITSFAKASELSDEPLSFYLSEGEHKLTLHGINTDFYISSIKLCSSSVLKSYSEIAPSDEVLEEISPLIDGKAICVEAEMPKYTNSAVLRPTSDRTDYTVSPSHPYFMRYNTIGADSWNSMGQTLFYEVSVPESGYYSLNIKCRLNTGSGLSANRRIYVNGAVPCKELNDIEIPYSADWQMISPQTTNAEPIFVQLNAGKNIIAFEAINGETGNALRLLNNMIYELSDCAESTEIYEKFGYFAEKITAAKSSIEAASGSKISASEIDVLVNLLKKYEKKQPNNLQDLKICLNSVYDWIEKNNNRSVEMDYFEIRTVHEKFSEVSRNFFKQLVFGFQRFIGSFFRNYSSASENEDSTEIFVASGNKDAQILKTISGKYSEKINVSVGTGSLLEMALSGKAPDVALFVDEQEVYELARRGLIVNLATLPQYGAVEDLSPSGVSRLYEYNGGKYAAALTNNFPVMFYRTDILEELGLSVPESWDDLERTLEVLNQKELTAGIGSPSDFSAENAFMLMLSQSGENFVGSELDLSQEYAKKAFARYSELYNKYGCPQDYDAVQLFKSGRMPIVIADYAEFYGKLCEESELRSLWKIAHVPGTQRKTETGNEILDFSANSNSLGAVIFTQCKDVAKAWDYISWFSQSEIQTEFGVMHEALDCGIYASSNLTSVANLRDTAIDYNRLRLQSSRINAIPKNTMSKALERGIYAAFIEAQKGKRSPEELIAQYCRQNAQSQ